MRHWLAVLPGRATFGGKIHHLIDRLGPAGLVAGDAAGSKSKPVGLGGQGPARPSAGGRRRVAKTTALGHGSRGRRGRSGGPRWRQLRRGHRSATMEGPEAEAKLSRAYRSEGEREGKGRGVLDEGMVRGIVSISWRGVTGRRERHRYTPSSLRAGVVGSTGCRIQD